jgi:hypothetical protein
VVGPLNQYHRIYIFRACLGDPEAWLGTKSMADGTKCCKNLFEYADDVLLVSQEPKTIYRISIPINHLGLDHPRSTLVWIIHFTMYLLKTNVHIQRNAGIWRLTLVLSVLLRMISGRLSKLVRNSIPMTKLQCLRDIISRSIRNQIWTDKITYFQGLIGVRLWIL